MYIYHEELWQFTRIAKASWKGSIFWGKISLSDKSLYNSRCCCNLLWLYWKYIYRLFLLFLFYWTRKKFTYIMWASHFFRYGNKLSISSWFHRNIFDILLNQTEISLYDLPQKWKSARMWANRIPGSRTLFYSVLFRSRFPCPLFLYITRPK